MVLCSERVGPSCTSLVYEPYFGVVLPLPILQSRVGVNHAYKKVS